MSKYYTEAEKLAVRSDESILLSMLQAAHHSTGGKDIYFCPLCGKKTIRNPVGGYWFCVNENCEGHKKGLDVFALYSMVHHVPIGTAIKAVMDSYGDRAAGKIITTGSCRTSLPASSPPARREMSAEDQAAWRRHCRQYCMECAARLPGSRAEAYMIGRGFLPETLARFRIGYDSRATVEGLFKYGFASVVIPYNLEMSYYQVRVIPHEDGSEITSTIDGKPIRYRMPREATTGIPEPLFNVNVIYHRRVVIFTEGTVDAMSVTQGIQGTDYEATVGAAALCGKEPSRLIAKLRERASDALLLFLLDDDGPGRKAAEDVGDQLRSIGHRDFKIINSGDVLHGFKDANELLQHDPGRMPEAVREILSQARNFRP